MRTLINALLQFAIDLRQVIGRAFRTQPCQARIRERLGHRMGTEEAEQRDHAQQRNNARYSRQAGFTLEERIGGNDRAEADQYDRQHQPDLGRAQNQTCNNHGQD